MPYVTPLAVILGVTLFSGLSSYSYLVQWAFAFISFVSCLGLNISAIRKALSRPLPIIVCLLLLQVIMPLIALGIGTLFFSGDPYIIMGLVLAYIIPTGVVSLMWVSIYKGNKAVTLSIVLINTLLSPLLVPFMLNLYVGTQVSMDTVGLMSGLFWMIVAPSVLGVIATRIWKNEALKAASTLAPFSKLSLIFVILVNGAVVSPYLQNLNGTIIFIGFIILLISSLGYWIGLFIARLLRWDKTIAISLMYNNGMRNNGAGAALAAAFFPPAAAFPIVVAILFQQFLASIFGRLAHYYFDHTEEKVLRFLKRNGYPSKEEIYHKKVQGK